MTIKAQNYIEFTYNKNKKKKEIADKAKKAVNDYIQKANGNIGKPVYLPEVNRNWENEIDNMVAGSGSGNEKKDICSKANEILALVFKEWQEAATKAAKSEETKTAETTFETEAEGSKAAISASATEIEKIIDDFQKTTLSDSFLFQTPADHENFQKKLVEHLPKPESYVAPTAGSDAERDWEAILGKLGKQGASKEEIERYLETAEKAARADNLKGKLAVAESKLRNETDWESWETEEEIRGWIRKIKDKLSKIETSEETETTAETSGEGSGRSVEKEWKDLSEEWFNTDQTDNSKLEVVFEKIKKYYSEMQAEDQEKYKEEWEDYDFSFLLCKAINFTREAEDSEEREKIGELIRQIEEIGAKISTDRYWGMNNLDTRLVALKEKYEKLEKETEKVETSGETSKHSETETPPVKEKEADTIVLTEEKLPEGDFTKKQLTKLYIKISDEILGLEEDGNEKIKVKLGRLEVLRQNWYVKGDPLITLTEKQLIEKSTKVQEEIERLKTKLLTEQETEWADEVPRELKKLREEWIKEIIPTSPEKLTEYKKIIFDDFPHYKGEFKLEEPNPDDSDEEEIEPEPEGYTKWRENYRNEHLKEWDLPALEKRLTDNYDKYKDLKKEVADILKINKYDEVNQHFSSKHYETLSKVIPAPIAATTAEIEEYKDMWGGSWGVIESNVYEAFDETELRNKLDWLKKEDYIARNQDKLNDWEKALVREKGVGVHTSTIQKWEEILPTAEFSKEFREVWEINFSSEEGIAKYKPEDLELEEYYNRIKFLRENGWAEIFQEARSFKKLRKGLTYPFKLRDKLGTTIYEIRTNETSYTDYEKAKDLQEEFPTITDRNRNVKAEIEALETLPPNLSEKLKEFYGFYLSTLVKWDNFWTELLPSPEYLEGLRELWKKTFTFNSIKLEDAEKIKGLQEKLRLLKKNNWTELFNETEEGRAALEMLDKQDFTFDTFDTLTLDYRHCKRVSELLKEIDTIKDPDWKLTDELAPLNTLPAEITEQLTNKWEAKRKVLRENEPAYLIQTRKVQKEVEDFFKQAQEAVKDNPDLVKELRAQAVKYQETLENVIKAQENWYLRPEEIDPETLKEVWEEIIKPDGSKERIVVQKPKTFRKQSASVMQSSRAMFSSEESLVPQDRLNTDAYSVSFKKEAAKAFGKVKSWIPKILRETCEKIDKTQAEKLVAQYDLKEYWDELADEKNISKQQAVLLKHLIVRNITEVLVDSVPKLVGQEAAEEALINLQNQVEVADWKLTLQDWDGSTAEEKEAKLTENLKIRLRQDFYWAFGHSNSFEFSKEQLADPLEKINTALTKLGVESRVREEEIREFWRTLGVKFTYLRSPKNYTLEWWDKPPRDKEGKIMFVNLAGETDEERRAKNILTFAPVIFLKAEDKVILNAEAVNVSSFGNWDDLMREIQTEGKKIVELEAIFRKIDKHLSKDKHPEDWEKAQLIYYSADIADSIEKIENSEDYEVVKDNWKYLENNYLLEEGEEKDFFEWKLKPTWEKKFSKARTKFESLKYIAENGESLNEFEKAAVLTPLPEDKEDELVKDLPEVKELAEALDLPTETKEEVNTKFERLISLLKQANSTRNWRVAWEYEGLGKRAEEFISSLNQSLRIALELFDLDDPKVRLEYLEKVAEEYPAAEDEYKKMAWKLLEKKVNGEIERLGASQESWDWLVKQIKEKNAEMDFSELKKWMEKVWNHAEKDDIDHFADLQAIEVIFYERELRQLIGELNEESSLEELKAGFEKIGVFFSEYEGEELHISSKELAGRKIKKDKALTEKMEVLVERFQELEGNWKELITMIVEEGHTLEFEILKSLMGKVWNHSKKKEHPEELEAAEQFYYVQELIELMDRAEKAKENNDLHQVEGLLSKIAPFFPPREWFESGEKDAEIALTNQQQAWVDLSKVDERLLQKFIDITRWVKEMNEATAEDYPMPGSFPTTPAGFQTREDEDNQSESDHSEVGPESQTEVIDYYDLPGLNGRRNLTSAEIRTILAEQSTKIKAELEGTQLILVIEEEGDKRSELEKMLRLIENAQNILGNKHRRRKYDLGLGSEKENYYQEGEGGKIKHRNLKPTPVLSFASPAFVEENIRLVETELAQKGWTNLKKLVQFAQKFDESGKISSFTNDEYTPEQIKNWKSLYDYPGSGDTWYERWILSKLSKSVLNKTDNLLDIIEKASLARDKQGEENESSLSDSEASETEKETTSPRGEGSGSATSTESSRSRLTSYSQLAGKKLSELYQNLPSKQQVLRTAGNLGLVAGTWYATYRAGKWVYNSFGGSEVPTPPQQPNQGVMYYQGLNEAGQPIFKNQTHTLAVEPQNLNLTMENVVLNEATAFLQDFEKRVLDNKKIKHNITGDIDDYLINIQKELEGWKEEATKQKQTIEDLTEKGKNKDNQLTNLEGEKKQLDEQVKQAQEELEIEKKGHPYFKQLRESFNNLDEQLKQLEESSEAEIKKLKEDKKWLETIRESLEETNEELEKTNYELRYLHRCATPAEERGILRYWGGERDAFRKQLKIRGFELNDKELELKSLKEEFAKAGEWLKRYHSKVEKDSYEKDQKHLEELIIKGKRISKLIDKVDLKDDEIAALKAALKAAQELNRNQEVVEEIFAGFNFGETVLAELRQELKQGSKKLKNRIEDLITKWESGEIDGREAEFQRLKEEISKLKEQNNNPTVGELEQKISDLTADYEQKRADYILEMSDAWNRNFQQLENEVNGIRLKYQDKEEEIERKDERIEDLEYENRELKKKLEKIDIRQEGSKLFRGVSDWFKDKLSETISKHKLTLSDRAWQEEIAKLKQQEEEIIKLKEKLAEKEQASQGQSGSNWNYFYSGLGIGGLSGLFGHKKYRELRNDPSRVEELEAEITRLRRELGEKETAHTRVQRELVTEQTNHQQTKIAHETQVNRVITELNLSSSHGSELETVIGEIKDKHEKHAKLQKVFKDELGFDPHADDLHDQVRTKTNGVKLNDISSNLRDLKDKPDTSTLTNQLNQANSKLDTYKNKLGLEVDQLDGKLGSKKLSNIPDGKTLEKLLQEDPTALQTKIDQLNAQLNDKEKEVVKSIHDALSLGIAEGSITKDEVLKKIREKIVGGGGDTQKDQQIKDLTAEVNNLKNQTNTIVKEVVVEKIVDNTKAQETYGFTFTTAEQEQIKSAGSAKEALAKTNEIIKGKMETLQSSKKTANTLNWVLGGLSVVSLVWLAYLLVKGSSNLLPSSETEKKNKTKNK